MTIWTTKEIAQQRYDICKSCKHFVHLTSQCDLCKCFMKIKVKLKNSTCPDSMWHEDIEDREVK